MEIVRETPTHLEIKSSSESMAGISCSIIFVAFYFILLLFWASFSIPLFSTLTCDRAPSHRVDCQLQESFLLNPIPKTTELQDAGWAKIRAIPDNWETTYVQLAANRNLLQFLKSSNQKIKIPSTPASVSIKRKKEMVAQINQFIRQRNKTSLKIVFKNFSFGKILYFAILFVAIIANIFRFRGSPSQYLFFDNAGNQLTVIEEYLFGATMEMKYSIDRIKATQIEQNKEQEFLISLMMESPLEQYTFGNFKNKQDAERIEACIQSFLRTDF